MGTGDYLFGVTIGMVSLMSAYNFTGHVPFNPTTPEQINIQKVDYNHDGVPDMLIERKDGREVPMYGVRSRDGKIAYFSASRMEKRDSDSVIDYSKIETMVNEGKK